MEDVPEQTFFLFPVLQGTAELFLAVAFLKVAVPPHGHDAVGGVDGYPGGLDHHGVWMMGIIKGGGDIVQVDVGFQGEAVEGLPVLTGATLVLDPAVKGVLFVHILASAVLLDDVAHEQQRDAGVFQGGAHIGGVLGAVEADPQDPVAAKFYLAIAGDPGVVADDLEAQGDEQPVV